MGGLRGIKRIEWPEEARLHHDDIAVFRRSFGPALTSALRLGYIYRLGPIAERTFFEPQDDIVVPALAPARWSHECAVAPPRLVLRQDRSLEPTERVRIADVDVASRARR